MCRAHRSRSGQRCSAHAFLAENNGVLFESHWAPRQIKNPPMQSISTAFVLVDIPTDWNPQANQQPTGMLVALPLMRQSRLVRAQLGTPPNKKIRRCKASADFLVGCPVGLEPTVSRSTIWRVNRLRYGHHIDAPEGTRTPGPLLRRQLLYPPELRAHVVIPWVPLWRQLCVGTRCEKYNTIQAPFCQAKNAKIFFLFSKPAKHCFTAATCPQSPKQSQARLRPRHRGYGARRSAHGQHR